MYKYFSLGCFMLIVNFSYSSKLLDSLNQVIETGNDTSKSLAYIKYGEQFYQNNPDTALILWNAAVRVSQKAIASTSDNLSLKTHYSAIATAYNNIAYVHIMKGNTETCISYYDSTKVFLDKTKDQEGIGNYYMGIGYIYMQMGNFPLALENYENARKAYETINNNGGIAIALNNLGYLYQQQEDMEGALVNYREFLRITTLLNDTGQMANACQNIAFIYSYENTPDSSFKYYRRSATYQRLVNNDMGLSSAYNSLGKLHQENGNIDSAEFYIDLAIEMKQRLNERDGLVASYIHKAYITRDKKNLKLANEYAEMAMKIASETGFVEVLTKVHELQYILNKEMGNFEGSLLHHEKFMSYRDSIKNDKNKKASIRQQTIYEFEKSKLIAAQELKEKERELLNQTERRDNLQYLIIFVVLLAIFGLILGLGFIQISTHFAEGLIFFAFLIFFEFILVLTDPYLELFTGGAPAYKLLINAVIAGAIFPAHAFFERALKKKLIRNKRK